MVNQFSPVQQDLAQLENLEENQLKQLLVELEAKKRLLPIDDHAIIDWGISTLKAKILDKERLMATREKAWESFINASYKDFIKKYSSKNSESRRHLSLKELDLSHQEARQRLYLACYFEVWEILTLTHPDYRKGLLRKAIEVFKDNLYTILSIQRRRDLYQKYIDRVIENIEHDINKNEDYQRRYQNKSKKLFDLLMLENK